MRHTFRRSLTLLCNASRLALLIIPQMSCLVWRRVCWRETTCRLRASWQRARTVSTSVCADPPHRLGARGSSRSQGVSLPASCVWSDSRVTSSQGRKLTSVCRLDAEFADWVRMGPTVCVFPAGMRSVCALKLSLCALKLSRCALMIKPPCISTRWNHVHCQNSSSTLCHQPVSIHFPMYC